MAIRVRRKKTPGIRAFFQKARLLAASGTPTTLKLQLMGFGRRGGYVSRWSRLSKKLPPQIKGLPTAGRMLRDQV